VEGENAGLNWMLADAMLDNVALKDVTGKSANARRASGGCGLTADRWRCLEGQKG
jgi:hypothetical protein